MQDILAARQADGSTAAEEAPSLVQAVWRERWVVLACILVAGALGVGLSTLQSPQYQATSVILLKATSDFDPQNPTANGDSALFDANQVAVIQTSEVLDTAVTLTKLNITVAQLQSDIKVTGATDSSVITIEATAGDAATAEKIADSVANAYSQYMTDKVKAAVAQALTTTKTPSAQQNLNAAAAFYGNGINAIEKASLPGSPSSPQPIRNALILALIGLLAGTGYALYTQSWSRRRVGPVEASAIFGAPVLCEIPDRGRISSEDAIAAAYSEPGDAYRMAAVGLDYIRGAAPGVFLVTAPHDGAGSSLTALNLAASAADHGRRVFLLNIEDTVRPQSDADAGVLRVPLHDLAQGRIDLGHAVERRAASRAQFGIIRLQVLQPVQGHPVPDVQQILDQLPDDTDLVLLDAPPLPASSASFVLAGQVDAAVVVVDEATTPADLEELQRRTRLAGIPVAGVLVNHIHRANSSGGRRRRRVAMGSVPPRLYDTSPRGLPILTGGAAVGDGRLHHPDSGGYGIEGQPPNGRGYGQAPEYAGNGQNGNGYGAQYGQNAPDRPGDLPWSEVTRVTPGWDQENAEPGGPNRSRR